MYDNRYNDDAKKMPVRKYSFPAGVCGANISIHIPVIATKADVRQMAKALVMVAEEWPEPDGE